MINTVFLVDHYITLTICLDLIVQAVDSSGGAAKRTKAGDGVEVNIREEAQKGRVSATSCNNDNDNND